MRIGLDLTIGTGAEINLEQVTAVVAGISCRAINKAIFPRVDIDVVSSLRCRKILSDFQHL